MDKPLSIARHDFQMHLVELVNKSKLSPYILEPIVKQLLDEILAAEERQLSADIEAYNKEAKEDDVNETST
jgi:hypothetical protein